MLTRQEIFNAAYLGLAAQGWAKSTAFDNHACLYRGPEGRKCAVGHLIPDELFNPDFEGCGAPHREEEDIGGDRRTSKLGEVFAKIGIAPDDFEFVRRLQYRHDDATNSPVLLREAFEDFAYGDSLAIPTQDR